MTTRYDRMRQAAQWIDDSCGEQTEIGNELRADADELEAVEAEARKVGIGNKMRLLVLWADRIRGEK